MATPPRADHPRSNATERSIMVAGRGKTSRAETRHGDWRLLDECEGFRVDSPGGPVGVVDALRFDGRPLRPSALVVRAGHSGRRQLLVAIEDIDYVLRSSRRIVLRSSPVRAQP
jgi:hypothetical protein